MSCGIYKITNLINGHFYIGQSVDIKQRFAGHKTSAKNLQHKDHNAPIHLAMAKYGCENFSYEILEECDRSQLNDREVFWIDFLQGTKNGNYNILAGGQDRIKFDDKPVEMYDLNGVYIKTVSSATEAAKLLGVNRSSIYGVLHKERSTCKGYQLKYQEDSKTIIKPFISKQGGKKAVYQIDPNTKKILEKFNSVAEAARQTGGDSSSISKVCRGKLKTCMGYMWKYEEDFI